MSDKNPYKDEMIAAIDTHLEADDPELHGCPAPAVPKRLAQGQRLLLRASRALLASTNGAPEITFGKLKMRNVSPRDAGRLLGILLLVVIVLKQFGLLDGAKALMIRLSAAAAPPVAEAAP